MSLFLQPTMAKKEVKFKRNNRRIQRSKNYLVIEKNLVSYANVETSSVFCLFIALVVGTKSSLQLHAAHGTRKILKIFPNSHYEVVFSHFFN